MRRLGGIAKALLVAAILVPLMSSTARADIGDDDPKDVSTSLDIERVAVFGHLLVNIPFIIHFYQHPHWRTDHGQLWIYIDSRAGPSYDYLIVASKRPGAGCQLFSRRALVGSIACEFGPQRVAGRVSRALLRHTHRIRYKVRAISRAGGHQVNDWAPGGFADWYPHA